MEDKEIMINDVDVSKCKYYNKNIKMDCLLYPRQPDSCSKNPNCLFKQLARKTKECEDLREALKEEVIYKRTYLKSLLDYKEECESLKSESFTREELISMQEKDIDHYRKALEELKNKLNEYERAGGILDEGEAWYHIAQKYEQVLDDIEEICRQLLDDDYIRSVAENLIDIIDKAKG